MLGVGGNVWFVVLIVVGFAVVFDCGFIVYWIGGFRLVFLRFGVDVVVFGADGLLFGCCYVGVLCCLGLVAVFCCCLICWMAFV